MFPLHPGKEFSFPGFQSPGCYGLDMKCPHRHVPPVLGLQLVLLFKTVSEQLGGGDLLEKVSIWRQALRLDTPPPSAS